MTRVAWLTPEFPPGRGGVSDHSAAMVRELRALGHEVLVCVKPHVTGFDRLDAELARFEPEAVVVAFVPLGFAPRTGGIAPAFLRWCIRLRGQPKVRKILLAHEVSLPVAKHWQRRQLKLALLGAMHMAQFEIAARCFDAVVFSHEASRALWAARLPSRREQLHTLRICSSIPLIDCSDPRTELEGAGYSVPAKTIFFFGTGHESILFDYLEAALVELVKAAPEAQLVIVGMDLAKLRRLCPSLADFGAKVQALGFVEARYVSLWLQVAELVLAPLADGVSARKTTVVAALQHGRAVVTTAGSDTRSDIAWSEICVLASLNRESFAADAVACFRDSYRRSQLGKAARSEYEAHAAAEVTAAQLDAYIAGAR